MYALDDKLRAVKLFNETKSFAVVKRMLGYPNSDDALRKWVKDYQGGSCNKREEYTNEEMEFAVEYYKECASASIVIKDLGYPKTKDILYGWIMKFGKKPCRERKKNVEYSETEKKEFVKLFLKSNKSQVSFSQDYDFTVQTLGNWIRRYSCVTDKEPNDMPLTNSNTIKTQEVEKVSTEDNTQNIETIDNESIVRLKKRISCFKS